MINEELIINEKRIANRVVFQPMEGCDCNTDGSPSELTVRKYMRFAKSRAGIIWFEANGVCSDGLTSPRQMMLTEKNADAFARLISDVKSEAIRCGADEPRLILQLTHSGRQSVKPITMYKNATYEKAGRTGEIASDEYLDALPYFYERSAKLAQKVGFDGIDVKACHGYLLSEAFSAYTREGKYGGTYENRTRLYKSCFQAAKSAISSDILLGARLGLSDMVAYPDGFGTDADGKEDFTEPIRLVSELYSEGLEVLNFTIGNPYYNPHINRPYKKGAYEPPEEPKEGLWRFLRASSAVKERVPDLAVVMSGLSYYGKEMVCAADAMIMNGYCDLAGFGRATLAYPEFYSDYLSGGLDERKLCLLCSKCTELMRAKTVSGCAVRDEYYRELYKNVVGAKK